MDYYRQDSFQACLALCFYSSLAPRGLFVGRNGHTSVAVVLIPFS